MGVVEMFNLTRVPSILLLGVFYMGYVLIGGLVFWKLEGDVGRQDISNLKLRKKNLLATYSCLDDDALEAVAQVVQEAAKVGLSLKWNYTTDGFWKFTSSSVFAATVVTTIGYGNMSPSTTAGQIFCVFFALIGIPLNLVVLNRVGKYMLDIEKNVSEFIEEKTGRKSMRILVHLWSYLSGIVLFFVAPMILFQLHEGWTYSQAIYYCFITLSTIGFGDLVADNNPERSYPDWYSILMASWIFFGLAWLALVINHSMDVMERLNGVVKGWWKRGKKDDSDTELDTPTTQVDNEKPPIDE